MRTHARQLAAGLACCVLVAGAGPAFGQRERTEVRTQETRTESATQVRRVSTVISSRVVLAQGGSVGKVEDIVINEDGCVDYLVVAYQDEFILVPWSITTVNFQEQVVRLDATRQTLRSVPTFTRGNWPNLSSRQYTQRLWSAWGVQSGGRGRHPGGAAGRQDSPAPGRPGTDRPADRERPGNRPAPDRQPTQPKPSDVNKSGDRPAPDRQPTQPKPSDVNKSGDRPTPDREVPPKSEPKKQEEKKKEEKKKEDR
jgi:sporulation protein YlmC with PRC-barrel domain